MGKSLQTIAVYSFFLLLSVSTISLAFSAQEKNKTSPTPTISQEEAKETKEVMDKEEKIEYVLPYPGILPDHPLYFLKVLRDRAMDFLIRDPLKRVEFNLLMSDKRINMGLFLSEKGRDELAQEVTKEGEDFFDKAIYELNKAKEQGREVTNELLDKLSKATSKHQEVLLELQEKSPEDKKEGYEKVLEMISSSKSKLEELGK